MKHIKVRVVLRCENRNKTLSNGVKYFVQLMKSYSNLKILFHIVRAAPVPKNDGWIDGYGRWIDRKRERTS